MQKIVYIYDFNTEEVDTLLEKGWKIISVNPVSVAQGKAYSIAAYVVLEKEEVNTTITLHNSSESQKVDINVNIKEKPHGPYYSFGDVPYYSFGG